MQKRKTEFNVFFSVFSVTFTCQVSIVQLPYPGIPELRECVYNDTEHNIEPDCGDNDEEWKIK